jgi:hypothetical protein
MALLASHEKLTKKAEVQHKQTGVGIRAMTQRTVLFKEIGINRAWLNWGQFCCAICKISW